VSLSGYYAWIKRPVSEHRRADEVLGEQIQQVYQSCRQVYGTRPSLRTLGMLAQLLLNKGCVNRRFWASTKAVESHQLGLWMPRAFMPGRKQTFLLLGRGKWEPS
jgi:hypothetical protein